MRHSRTIRRAGVITLALTALAVGAAAPTSAQSAAVFVDRDSLGGSCSDARTAAEVSAATPWCSLQRAVDAAPSGSTVTVRQATYPTLSVDGGPSRDAYLNFVAGKGEQPSIILSLEDTSYLSFEGFKLRYATWLTRVDHIRLRGNEITPNGVVVRTGSFLDFEDNNFHDIESSPNSTIGGYAIRLATGPNSDVRVVGNRFDRITADGVQAGSTTRLLIEDNEFSRVNGWDDPTEHSDAVQFSGTVTDATIRKNWIRNSNKGVIAKDAVFRGLVIENNLIHDTLQGLNLYDTPGARIVNNTIWNASTFGLRLRSLVGQQGGIVLANNIIQNSQAASTFLAVDVANLVDGSPLFGPGYELTADSPAVNAASAQYAPATDGLGRARVGEPDLGAREFGSSLEPTPDTEPTPDPTPGPEPTPDPEPDPDPTPEPGPSYCATVLGTTGLVSYWRLGESAGSVAGDATGTNAGKYAGFPALNEPGALAGDPDTAVRFDGVNDEMSVTGKGLALGSSGSLEGWFDASSGVALMRDHTRVGGWILAFDSGGKLAYRLGGTTFVTGRDFATLGGGWHHVVATKSGGATALYVDGQLVHSGTGAGSTAAKLPWHVMRNGNRSEFTRGGADEVAVYDAALTAAQVSEHYASSALNQISCGG